MFPQPPASEAASQAGAASAAWGRTTEVHLHWIWFIIVGAIVGLLGRLVHPGRDAMGLLATTAIGVVSMIVAAAISSGWLAFVIGVVIAAILVAVVGHVFGDRGRTLRRA
jgi:uncharacterized membrane protein YeaQ/YmgE (transglycosylase-associated protein family)